MSVKAEKIETNVVQLTIEVSVEDVNAAIDKSFKKNVAKTNVPGFRKGKVPKQMFMKMFGAESLYPDAIDIVINDAYAKAVESEQLNPVHYPEIDYTAIVGVFKKDTPLEFVAKVTVRPEPELGQYKGVAVEKLSTEVTDADVDADLETLQNRKAEWVLKEEGAAELGDTVVIDFEGFVDGEAFEGGKGTNHSLELGSGSFIPGFEEQLVGHGLTEEVEVKVTFPEEYHAEDLAGKEAVFKCLIHEIKTKEAPELTDEFAKEMDNTVETLDELKEKTKDRLQQAKLEEAKRHLENAVVDAAVANAKLEIPEIMIKNEMDYMKKDFEQRMQAQGMTLDLYFQYTGQDEAALEEQMKPEAEKQISRSLVLSAIAEAEKLEVTPEDVDDEIKQLAIRLGMTVEDIEKNLGANKAGLMNDLLIKKTVDFLVENCVSTKED